MNKETVEEAAEKCSSDYYRNWCGTHQERNIKKEIISAFKEGAEWQKEQSKPSIPNYEKLNDTATEYSEEKCRIMGNIKCLTARKTAYIDGYQKALKDLGHANV
jgi:hypothetical protein